MQIFAVSSNPKDCAESLCNKRLNKMILETSQLLAASIYLRGIGDKDYPTRIRMIMGGWHSLKASKKCDWLPSSPGWHNHPLAKWTLNDNHFGWLLLLFSHLLWEWKVRFEKPHSYHTHYQFYHKVFDILTNSDEHPITEVKFLNHTIFKEDKESIHDIYKKYLYWKWKTQDKRPPKWTNRDPPFWYKYPTSYILGAAK